MPNQCFTHKILRTPGLLNFLFFVFLYSAGLASASDSTFKNAPAQLQVSPSAEGTLIVMSEFTFIDKNTKLWIAPKGTITDGASIPTVFVPIIGDRLDSKHLNAAIIHDAYCSKENKNTSAYQTEPWEKVHRMFYHALIASGTSKFKAKVMYASVYLGGPRWEDDSRRLSKVSDADLQQELKWCIQLIRKKNFSADEIEQWMTEREPNLLKGKSVKPAALQ